MKLTNHAKVRIRQRGISEMQILLISIFGVIDEKKSDNPAGAHTEK